MQLTSKKMVVVTEDLLGKPITSMQVIFSPSTLHVICVLFLPRREYRETRKTRLLLLARKSPDSSRVQSILLEILRLDRMGSVEHHTIDQPDAKENTFATIPIKRIS